MILSADALGPVEMQHLEKPLATTPKYHLLWKALANRQETRRVGR
jgi:hypothetical protein